MLQAEFQNPLLMSSESSFNMLDTHIKLLSIHLFSIGLMD